ncbi:MAG: hypothetical protein H6999_03975 [Hahellaceae bacterium]|nr:hypothetical protein [Hahellaceae bacterium]MCP5168895.1 hypothetical protein [Hahellaceae bacterium]
MNDPTVIDLPKLQKPQLPRGITSREILNEQLNEILNFPLTLISAPAGFGKTTAINFWLDTHRIPYAWVSLDETDNQPATFWHSICLSLCRLDKPFFLRLATRLCVNTEDNPVHIAQIFHAALMEYSRTWKSPPQWILVLDDFHLVNHPDIHRAFNHLLDHIPSFLKVVMTTRHQPSLKIPRRRARDQILEFGSTQLQFDKEACRQFLKNRHELQLGTQQLDILFEKTGGWIAALQLAAIALKDQGKAGHTINDFNGNHALITDYLLDEIFDDCSPEWRQFLAVAALFPRIHVNLMNHVLEIHDSQAMLEEMSIKNLLVLSLDSEGRWFRLHELFRDWLRANVPVTPQKNSILTSAARWFACRKDWTAAIALAYEGDDKTLAVQLLIESLPDLVANGLLIYPGRIIALFDTHWKNNNPWICFLDALHAFNQGSHALTETRFARTQWLLNTTCDYAGCADINPVQLNEAKNYLQKVLTFARMYVWMLTGNLSAAQHSSTALEPEDWQSHPQFHAWILQLKGVDAFFQDHISDASIHLSQALEASKAADDLLGVLTTLNWLVPCLSYQGQIAFAAQLLTETQEKLPAFWLDHPLTSNLHYLRAFIQHEQGNFDLAEIYLNQAFETASAHISPLNLVYFHFLRWSIACFKEQRIIRNESVTYLLHQQRLLEEANGWSHAFPEPVFLDAAGSAQDGHFLPILQWGKHFSARDPSGPRCRYSEEEVQWLRLETTRGINKDAEISELLRIAESHQFVRRQIQCWLLLTISADLRGQTDKAAACFKEALECFNQSGLLRCFSEFAGVIRPYLERARQHLQTRHTATQILRHLDSLQQVQATDNTHSPKDTLSEREREVLTLLSAGHNNQSLAATLSISLATVKTHLRNIYTKLDAKNRTQALSIARDIGLL